jgi:hypothetical protein
MIFGLYGILRIFFFTEGIVHDSRLPPLLFLAASFVGAGLLAFPQIYLTFPLAIQSNRAELSESYAYIGSLSPFAFATLIDPMIQYVLRGNCLYSGLFSLYLILLAFHSKDVRSKNHFRLWAVMTLIVLLLALGGWSPLYIAIIKLTRFYSFRMPSKFLVFACFGFAMMAGYGLQKALSLASSRPLPASSPVFKAVRSYLIAAGFFVLLCFAAYLGTTVAKDYALKFGEWFVHQYIYGKPGHHRSLESYLGDLNAYLSGIQALYSFAKPVNRIIFTGIMLSLFFTALPFLRKKITKPWIYGGLAFLFLDLFLFSWIDIQQDYALYAKAVDASSPMIQALDSYQKQGRLGRVFGYRSLHEGLPLVPSKNMLYGIQDTGMYSPFVMKRYFETVGLLGNVNDSTYAASPEPDFVTARLPLLSSLNVSHVLSFRELNHPQLRLLFHDAQSQSYLYENAGNVKPAYFVNRVQLYPDWASLKADYMKASFDPQAALLLEHSELSKIPDFKPEPENIPAQIQLLAQSEDSSSWEVSAGAPGFFVIPNTMFEGWRAELNGKEVPVLKAYGIFQAVYLPGKGLHQIRFDYHPVRFKK